MTPHDHSIEISLELHGPTTVVAVVGSVDTLTAEDLLDSFRTEIGNGRTQLVSDFSGVDYTSSAGLRAILAAAKEARQNGGDLRLAAVSDRVFKVLDLSGFTSILRLYPDVPEAVASYTS